MFLTCLKYMNVCTIYPVSNYFFIISQANKIVIKLFIPLSDHILNLILDELTNQAFTIGNIQIALEVNPILVLCLRFSVSFRHVHSKSMFFKRTFFLVHLLHRLGPCRHSWRR